MVAKVNGGVPAFQSPLGPLEHYIFNSGPDFTDNAVAEAIINIIEDGHRSNGPHPGANVVLIGALKGSGGNQKIALQSPSTWTAATLSTALGMTVLDYVY